MKQALIVVDAQNEFSAAGQRPVPNHSVAFCRSGLNQYISAAATNWATLALVRAQSRSAPSFVAQYEVR